MSEFRIWQCKFTKTKERYSATLLLTQVSLSHLKANTVFLEKITFLSEGEISPLTRSRKMQRKQYHCQPRNLNPRSSCAHNSAMGQSITFHWTFIFSSIKLGCSIWWYPRFLPAVSPTWRLCAGWINFRNEISNMLQKDTFTPTLADLFTRVKGKQGDFRWKPHLFLHLIKTPSDSCDRLVRTLTRQHPLK